MINIHRLLVLFFSTVFVFSNLSSASTGTGVGELREFQFRVTDHQAGIEDFIQLDVILESFAIHPSGEARNEGWIEFDNEYFPIDIVPLKNGRSVSTGIHLAPWGTYDAVRVKFKNVSGKLHNGMPPRITGKNTTVSASFDLHQIAVSKKPIALVLDLYVESQTDHEPNLYVVKIKEVRVEQ